MDPEYSIMNKTVVAADVHRAIALPFENEQRNKADNRMITGTRDATHLEYAMIRE